MKAKFGAIVVDGRGKLGGHVASKNKFGSFFRTKVTPVNPATTRQAVIRGGFAAFAAQWSQVLTQGERDGWIGLAAVTAITNIFGDTKFLTGMNFYIRTNQALQSAGYSPITIAPPTLNGGNVVAGALTVTAGGAGTGTIAFTTDSGDADHKVNVYATNNLSPGINFVKSNLRFIGSYSSTVSPIDFAADWRAKWGSDGMVAGKKVFIALQGIDSTTGALGIPTLTSTIVP